MKETYLGTGNDRLSSAQELGLVGVVVEVSFVRLEQSHVAWIDSGRRDERVLKES